MASEEHSDNHFQNLMCELAYESQKLVKNISTEAQPVSKTPRFMLEYLKRRNEAFKSTAENQSIVQNRIKTLGIDFSGIDNQISTLKDHMRSKKKDSASQVAAYQSDFSISSFKSTKDFNKEYLSRFRDYSMTIAVYLNSNFPAHNPNKSALMSMLGNWDAKREQIYLQNKDRKSEVTKNFRGPTAHRRTLQSVDRKQVLSKKHLSINVVQPGTLDSSKTIHMSLLMNYLREKSLKGKHAALLHWIYELMLAPKNPEMKQIWKMIRYQYDGTTKERPSESRDSSIQEEIEQSSFSSSTGKDRIMVYVQRSCSFLENEFYSSINQRSEHIYSTQLLKRLPRDTLNRVEFCLNYLSQFLQEVNLRKREGGMEDAEFQLDAFGVPTWGLIYMLTRAGFPSDVFLLLSLYTEETLDGVESFKRTFRKWFKTINPDHPLPEEHSEGLGLGFRDMGMREDGIEEEFGMIQERPDIFYNGLHVLMGVSPNRPYFLLEENKTDFFWLTLKTIETNHFRTKQNQKKDWENSYRDLSVLQRKMIEESQQKSASSDPFTNVQQLFLSMLHWEGASIMKQMPSYRTEFIHLMIVLYESGILTAEHSEPEPSEQNPFRNSVLSEVLPFKMSLPPRIENQVVQEVYQYVRDIAKLKPFESIAYFQIFPDQIRTEKQAELIFNCELIGLIFDNKSQEARMTKKNLVEMLGDDQFRRVCKKVSENISRYTRYVFSDILLFEYIEDYAMILEKILISEARAISQINNKTLSLSNDPEAFSGSLAFDEELRRFLKDSQVARKIEKLKEAEVYLRIVEIKLIIQIFMIDKRPFEAFSKFCSSQIIPKSQRDYGDYSKYVDAQSPESLKLAYVEALVALQRIIEECLTIAKQKNIRNEMQLDQLVSMRRLGREFYQKHLAKITQNCRESGTFGPLFARAIDNLEKEYERE